VNGFLVRDQRGLSIEDTLAVVDAAEERHLVSDAEQSAVLLALVPGQTALVLETGTTAAILTQVQFAVGCTSFQLDVAALCFYVLKCPQGNNDAVSFHIYASWFSPPCHGYDSQKCSYICDNALSVSSRTFSYTK